MIIQSTIDTLKAMRFSAMAGELEKQLNDPACNLRRTAATGAFASGHPAEPNGHLH